MDKLKEFLASIGLDQYYEKLTSVDLTYDLLYDLDKNDLKAEGISIGHALRLLRALKETTSDESLDISEYPDFIQIMLRHYKEQNNDKIKLWYVCDFYEYLLRFQVILSLSELYHKSHTIESKIIKDIYQKIKRPTMGAWLMILDELTKLNINSEIILSMNKNLIEVMTDGDKKSEEESIITLRNKLAHGGTFTKVIVNKLNAAWERRLKQHLTDLTYLKSLNIKPSGEMLLVTLNESKLDLSPFFVKGDVYQLYLRMPNDFLEYTPIHDDESYESLYIASTKEIGDAFTKIFDMIKPDEPQVVKYKFHGMSENTIQSECNKLVGRSHDVKKIVDHFYLNEEKLLWVTGNPGNGKSYLMSAVVQEMQNKDNHLVLSYRFEENKSTFNKNDFIHYAVERLMYWDGCNTEDLKVNPGSSNHTMLFKLLKRVKVDYKVCFILDGLDEMSKSDHMLLSEIVDQKILGLEGHFQWLFFSRDDADIMKILDGDAHLIYPNGLEALDQNAVNMMIFNDLDTARYKILEKEELEGDLLINPFLNLVYEKSKGNPLYVNLLITEIRNGTLNRFTRSTELPKSLEAYTEKLLREYDVNEYSHFINFIIVSLYLSREPLPYNMIYDMYFESDAVSETEEKKAIFEMCFKRIRPLIKKNVEDDETASGYVLYHKNIIETLDKRSFSPMIEKQRYDLVFSLIKTEKEHLKIFAYKWLFQIILGDNKHYDYLYEKVQDLDYLFTKKSYQSFENYMIDINDVYHLLTSERENVIKNIILTVLEATENPIAMYSDLNAVLMYQKQRVLYNDLIDQLMIYESTNHCTKDINKIRALACNSKIGLTRRLGKIQKAIELVESYESFILENSDDKGKSSYEYAVAYIYYLQGNVDESIKHFDQSILYAQKCNNIIGECITKCVKAHTQFVADISNESHRHFLEVLDNSWQFFQNEADKGNLTASRWIYNVLAHKYQALIKSKMKTEAQIVYKQLVSNPWLKKYHSFQLTKYKIYLDYINEDFDEVVKYYQESLSKNLEEQYSQEALSCEYVYYCTALVGNGKKEEALKQANIGLSLPADNGNLYYFDALKKIRKACQQELEVEE